MKEAKPSGETKRNVKGTKVKVLIGKPWIEESLERFNYAIVENLRPVKCTETKVAKYFTHVAV